jgi:hypothetical protein
MTARGFIFWGRGVQDRGEYRQSCLSCSEKPLRPTKMAKQPWEVPDIPQCGDASQDDTFRAVGAALSQWELFEGNLSLAFSYFVGTGYGNIAALRAYGSVETFRGRANMIETAAEVYFKHTPDPQLQILLKEILKQSRQFSSRRNEVAHGIVSPFVGRDEADEWINLGFVLYPAYYATRKRQLPASIPLEPLEFTFSYSSVEIYKFRDHFDKLAADVVALLTGLARHSMTRHSS